jgi:hypothetical protein
VGSRASLDRRGKSRPPPGFDSRTIQPVAIRYTDYSIPAHIIMVVPAVNKKSTRTQMEKFGSELKASY